FLPAVLNTSCLDGAIKVATSEAKEWAKRCAREEGILIGISSGASLAAVAKTLAKSDSKLKILTFCYDTGERYLSIPDFLPE
ncbi:MAG: cysteine synthase A, partial [Bdellovibrionales bacterium]|nr:cysteine synthase A [Bdellovibrionales bacterium]